MSPPQTLVPLDGASTAADGPENFTFVPGGLAEVINSIRESLIQQHSAFLQVREHVADPLRFSESSFRTQAKQEASISVTLTVGAVFSQTLVPETSGVLAPSAGRIKRGRGKGEATAAGCRLLCMLLLSAAFCHQVDCTDARHDSALMCTPMTLRRQCTRSGPGC